MEQIAGGEFSVRWTERGVCALVGIVDLKYFLESLLTFFGIVGAVAAVSELVVYNGARVGFFCCYFLFSTFLKNLI